MAILDLTQLQQKKEELERQLGDPVVLGDVERVKALSIEFSKIENKIKLGQGLVLLEKQEREAHSLLEGGDKELTAMAREELALVAREKQALLAKISADENLLPDNLIMEIRAGVGGEEASLFAQELFHMYTQFAKNKKWNTTLIDESKSDLGGYKEVIFEINGDGAYASLQWESGVHRVQRIPATEKSGRVHTSTASVAVLPKAREVDVEVRPQDIKIEFFRSSGPGGQNVNKVETAVRIYHLSTGLIVTSQKSRSQQKNREHAMTLLRSRLLDARMQDEAKKRAAERKQQIGTGDRSEKIRTYNFPQDRVTDHRIKESWHNIPSIMQGNIEPIIEALDKNQ